MLKIRNITKKFGSFSAVDNLNLEINQPGLYLLIGDNGSGKTTLLNMMAGFVRPCKGQISINGSPDADYYRHQLGISTEPFSTEPSLTVIEIAEIVQQIKRVPSAETHDFLKQWELWAVREKPFKTLSTGMKKRLSLALSMLGNPLIYLWDEPFNSLDPLGIGLLNRIIRELTVGQKTIFLSTHLPAKRNCCSLHFCIYYERRETNCNCSRRLIRKH